MFCHFLVCGIVVAQSLTINLYDYSLSDKAIWHGIVDFLYTDGGMFVNIARLHIEASEVTGEMQHGINIIPKGFLFVPCGYTSFFSIDAFTDT